MEPHHFLQIQTDYFMVFEDIIQVLLTLKGDPVLCREGRAEEGAGITALDFAGVTLNTRIRQFGIFVDLPLSSLCQSLVGRTFWDQISSPLEPLPA